VNFCEDVVLPSEVLKVYPHALLLHTKGVIAQGVGRLSVGQQFVHRLFAKVITMVTVMAAVVMMVTVMVMAVVMMVRVMVMAVVMMVTVMVMAVEIMVTVMVAVGVVIEVVVVVIVMRDGSKICN
jgi:hypothetical protein